MKFSKTIRVTAWYSGHDGDGNTGIFFQIHIWEEYTYIDTYEFNRGLIP